MSGYPPIALLGGEGLRPDSIPLWQQLVSLMPGSRKDVVVIPAVLPDKPIGQSERRTKTVIEALARVGIEPIVIPVDDENPHISMTASRIPTAIFLAGGEPHLLCQRLQGSTIWKSILEMHQQGSLLIAAGSAAVALGEWAFAPQRPYPEGLNDLLFEPFAGLGLLKELTVLPYFSWLQDALVEQLTALLPNARLVGIDDQAALLASQDGWMVDGLGTITIFGIDDSRHVFDPGQRIPAEILLPHTIG